MSIVGRIIKSGDDFVFSYGVSFSEGKFMVRSRTQEGIQEERERLLKVECQAGQLYGYYEQGYYKGRFTRLKPVLEEVFKIDEVFYSWSIMDDWLWKLYEESPDLDHFVYGLLRYSTGYLKTEPLSKDSYRNVKIQERKLEFLEAGLEEMEKTEDLCMVRLMKETGIRIGDLEDIEWNNVRFPYIAGVMAQKTRSLYPVTQISEKTYKLLTKLKRSDEKVFHRNQEAFCAAVRKAIAGEFGFSIHELRWYWRNTGVKVQAPELDPEDIGAEPIDE